MFERGRLWSALALLALSSGGCAGDYPLEPTACDDFCNVTQGTIPYCTDYDPAQCVVQCEAGSITRPECLGELQAVLDCFIRTPTAISDQCSHNEAPQGCRGATEFLALCLYGNSLGAPPPAD